MKRNRMKVFKNLLPIDHFVLRQCECIHPSKHCNRDVWGFTHQTEWSSHVRMPAPEECRSMPFSHALVLASTVFGGGRIVMAADAETVRREKARHDFLRAASPVTTPVRAGLYDHWTHKWFKRVHRLRGLTGSEGLEFFLEVVDAYTPEMLPYVLACGEPPGEDAILDSQMVSGILVEA